jgi:hypothetical protein
VHVAVSFAKTVNVSVAKKAHTAMKLTDVVMDSNAI